MRPAAATGPALLSILLLAPLAGLAQAPDDTVQRVEGEGTWEGQTANATWIDDGDRVHAFLVRGPALTLACLSGPTPAAGGVLVAGDAVTPGTCSGTRSTDTSQVEITFLPDPAANASSAQRGMFRPTQGTAIGPAATTTPQTPSPWPGVALASLAVVGIAGAAVVGLLYLRERRLAGYLVRRLFEETKGKVPQDWPEAVRRQTIARIMVRNRN